MRGRGWLVLVGVLVLFGAAPREVAAQSRADSAAVLLRAAEDLRSRGDEAAARAVLRLIAERFAGTPAAAQVEGLLAAVRRAPDIQRSGRTELLVWGTTYGAWLGLAVPISLESDSPEAYGLGLLVGAPAGFFAAKRYAEVAQPTEGQARAITFGGTWGTYQGVGWLHATEIGRRTYRDCPPPEYGPCYEFTEEPGGAENVTAALIGGLAGIGTGVWLARKPISAGTAAAVTLSGFWGTWYGWAGGYVLGIQDEEMLTAALLAGNAALLVSGYIAPRWEMSENRARLISVGGLIGVVAGAGVALLAQPNSERVAVALPVAGSALGLLVGAAQTRSMDEAGDREDGADAGALLQLDGNQWRVGTPMPVLRLERAGRELEPRVHVPLLRARFN